jgi:hypothetical protein
MVFARKSWGRWFGELKFESGPIPPTKIAPPGVFFYIRIIRGYDGLGLLVGFLPGAIEQNRGVRNWTVRSSDDQNYLTLRLTVCVTGAGVGVDSVWEQEKLEARKMLGNAAESPASSACFVGWRFSNRRLFFSLKPVTN